MPGLSVVSAAIATDSEDEDGLVVSVDGRIAAILVRLAGPRRGGSRRSWFLEAGFGRCAAPPMEPFDRLTDALRWIVIRSGRSESSMVADMRRVAARFGDCSA